MMKTRGWLWIMLAYPVAASVGAAVVAVGFAVMGLVVQIQYGMTEEILPGLWITPAAFIYGFLIFLVGLLLIGTPVWLVLVRLGQTRRRTAVLAGAALCFLVGCVFVLAAGEPATAWQPWAFAASLAFPGAAAGWTLHRVAYGR